MFRDPSRLAVPAKQAVAEHAKAGTTCRHEIPEAERVSSLSEEGRSPDNVQDPVHNNRGDKGSVREARHGRSRPRDAVRDFPRTGFTASPALIRHPRADPSPTHEHRHVALPFRQCRHRSSYTDDPQVGVATRSNLTLSIALTIGTPVRHTGVEGQEMIDVAQEPPEIRGTKRPCLAAYGRRESCPRPSSERYDVRAHQRIAVYSSARFKNSPTGIFLTLQVEGALRFDSCPLKGVAADQSNAQLMGCAFGLPGNRHATPYLQATQ